MKLETCRYVHNIYGEILVSFLKYFVPLKLELEEDECLWTCDNAAVATHNGHDGA